MEILLVVLIGAGVLYYLYKKMNQPDNMNSLHDHTATPTVPPMPEPQPVPEVPTITSASQLPEGWNTYTPSEKIAFFNTHGVTEKQLLDHGVTSDDIAWMRANGYIVGLKNIEKNTDTHTVKKNKTRDRVKKAADLDGDGRVTLKDVKVAATRARKTAGAVADRAAKAVTKSRAKK